MTRMPGFDEVRFTALDELRALLTVVDARDVESLAQCIEGAPRVFCAGAGRSGLAMRAFAMRLMHMGVEAHVVGDVTTPAFGRHDLLVVGSGSGATGSLVAMAEKARALGGTVGLVTIERESPIGRVADVVARIPASTPKKGPASRAAFPDASADGAPATVASRQPMASLFEQALWILLDAVILLLMRAKGLDTDAMFARHANLE